MSLRMITTLAMGGGLYFLTSTVTGREILKKGANFALQRTGVMNDPVIRAVYKAATTPMESPAPVPSKQEEQPVIMAPLATALNPEVVQENI